MEDDPFHSDDNHVSDKTINNVLTDLKRYNTTFNEAAQNNGISTMGALKIFDKYCQMNRLPMPKVLCIDEIYFSRKRKRNMY